MKDQIIALITKYPKHYTRFVKNDELLVKWINAHSLIISENFPEMIYSAIYQKKPSWKEKFADINVGYRFYGRAGTCQCCAAQVSDKIKTSKSQQDHVTSNTKRIKTCLEKYGADNARYLTSYLEKTKQSCLDKYDTSHWTKTDIARKALSERNKQMIDIFKFSGYNVVKKT